MRRTRDMTRRELERALLRHGFVKDATNGWGHHLFGGLSFVVKPRQRRRDFLRYMLNRINFWHRSCGLPLPRVHLMDALDELDELEAITKV